MHISKCKSLHRKQKSAEHKYLVSEGNSPSTQNSKKSLYSTVIYLCQLNVYHTHITFFSIKTLLHMTRSNIHITTKNISNVYVNIFRTSFLTLPSWFLHIFSHFSSVIIRNLLDTIQKRHRRRLL